MVETLVELIDWLWVRLPDWIREFGLWTVGHPKRLGGALLVLGTLAWLLARRARQQSAPHLPVAGWEKGAAWFTGRVRATGDLKSPYLRQPCVFYAFDVGHQHQQDQQPFILEDKTGRVLVVPDQARFLLTPAFEAHFRPDEPDPGLLLKLGQAGVRGVEDLLEEHPRLQVTERLLPPEGTVAVRGTLRDPLPEDRLDPAWGIHKVLVASGGELIVAEPAEAGTLEQIRPLGILLYFGAFMCWGMAAWWLARP